MELKDYDILDIEAIDDERVKREIAPGKVVQCSRVYLKSEADKVIAELQKQVHDYAQGLYVIQARADKDARHQKYKRCLAMANYWVAVSYQCVDDKHRQSAERHHRKWLELAKKFKDKEAK